MRAMNNKSPEKLELFLSSVCGEFKRERSELKDFLERELYVEVYLSENDEKPEDTPEEKLTKRIDDCDIVILLLGGQFGSKHPQKNISITQWEFEIANNLHKYWLAFCKKDVEFEECQKEFKEKVFNFSEGKDVPYFSGTEELKEKIKKHIIGLMSMCTKKALPTLNNEHMRGKFFIDVYPVRTTGFAGGITRVENSLDVKLQIKFYNNDREHDYDIDNIRVIIWEKIYKGHPAYQQGKLIFLPIKIQKRSSQVVDVKFSITPPSNDDRENKEKSDELMAEFKKLKSCKKSDYFKVDFDVV